jgi:hypothetical protein
VGKEGMKKAEAHVDMRTRTLQTQGIYLLPAADINDGKA